MSSNDDQTTGSNVFPFPRIGFTLTPTTGPAGTPDTAGASTTTAPDWDAVTVTNSGRRSPLDALNALPDPGLTAPLVPYTAPPAPGTVPDTFRGEPAPDLVGPRIGALSLAACLAVAVAALRGTHTVLSTWWENRQARAAESAPLREARAKHQAAMQAIGDKAAEQRAKAASKVPSSSEFGRKTLGGGGRSGGSGSSGRSGGSGKSGGSGSGGSSGRKPSGRSGSGNSSSSGRGSSGHASGGRGKTPSKTPTTPGSKKTPTNTSQRKNTSGKTAPGRGKSPSSSSTSPAMERGRRRQDRTDKRQAARLKRKADRQAARLKDQAKDHAADRTRKEAAKDARREARAKARTARTEDKRAKKEEKKAAPGSLGNAVRKEAARRLKKRRKTLTPILSKAKTPKTPKAAGKDTADKASSPKGTKPGAGKPGTAGTKPPKKRTSRIRWGKRASKRKGRRTPGAGGWRFPGSTPGPGTTSTPPPGGGRTRRSPFESAAHTAPTTYTVTSDHVPGSRAKRWEPDGLTTGAPALPATGPAALDAAPTTAFPRPGTTRPKEARPMPPTPARQDPRLVKARHQAARTGQQVIAQARHMDAQHETEITLDDALDEYGDFKDDGFKTHDQASKLAARGRKLQGVLALFAEELATDHNVVGALFSAAMARMSESMDLLARMSDEMQISSLEAAELAEAADNDLNDAYRPITQATADAGLATPSAPIHNQS
ncbi:hypothetical protein [Streptomyces sp. LUP47B]|uniref:hypothetical protein n=1 Tax=Streptomyces sp. LUP47B TaxID=1890286 RepID=UPI0008518FE0|nr:hypothetical protein [Streptomyces sp. LUP47B]